MKHASVSTKVTYSVEKISCEYISLAAVGIVFTTLLIKLKQKYLLQEFQ